MLSQESGFVHFFAIAVGILLIGAIVGGVYLSRQQTNTSAYANLFDDMVNLAIDTAQQTDQQISDPNSAENVKSAQDMQDLYNKCRADGGKGGECAVSSGLTGGQQTTFTPTKTPDEVRQETATAVAKEAGWRWDPEKKLFVDIDNPKNTKTLDEMYLYLDQTCVSQPANCAVYLNARDAILAEQKANAGRFQGAIDAAKAAGWRWDEKTARFVDTANSNNTKTVAQMYEYLDKACSQAEFCPEYSQGAARDKERLAINAAVDKIKSDCKNDQACYNTRFTELINTTCQTGDPDCLTIFANSTNYNCALTPSCSAASKEIYVGKIKQMYGDYNTYLNDTCKGNTECLVKAYKDFANDVCAKSNSIDCSTSSQYLAESYCGTNAQCQRAVQEAYVENPNKSLAAATNRGAYK